MLVHFFGDTMKRQFGFSIAIAAAAFSLMTFRSLGFPQARQQPPQPSVDALKVQKVRDNLYLITEGGGNTTVFITMAS